MAMTFLQLCQRVVSEGDIAGTGPSAVLSQTGILGKVVKWTQQAWVEIQLERDNWDFMWKEFTFDTTIDQRDYLAADESITDLALWDRDSFLIFKTSLTTADQNELQFMEYGVWRNNYRSKMTSRDSQRPQLFTILPNNKIRFEPVPDAAYTIEGEYKKTAQVFAADGDVPTDFPDDFDLMIVWQALKYYGFHEDAPDVLDMAETNFDNLLVRLEEHQMPTMSEAYAGLA